MKFTAKTADLRRALDKASAVMTKSPSQIVYTGVRMKVTDGVLTVTGASDGGGTSVSVSLPVTQASSGTRVLTPGPLQAYLADLPARTIVSVDAGTGSEMVVRPEGASAYRFRLMEATYPRPLVPAGDPIPADLSNLAAALKSVKDAVRATATTVQLVAHGSSLHLHTSDSARLARAIIPAVRLGEFKALLPLAAVEQLAALEPTSVHLDPRGRVFAASSEDSVFVARVSTEKYPPVEDILDDAPPHSAELPLRALQAALGRLSAVAARTPVHIRIAGDTATLDVESSDLGAGREEVPLASPARVETKFAVSLRYLQEALAAHRGESVTLGYGQPDRAIALNSAAPLAVTTVVMPVII